MAVRGRSVTLDDIDDELFGEPHQNTLSYLRERVERHAGRAMEIFDGFFEDARDTYERYNGERALRRIRSRIRKTADVFKGDVIRPLRSLEDIQHAKPKMQRYLMANIMASIALDAQVIDGYSDDYVNYNQGKHGWDNPDYRRVMDGMVMTDDRFGVVLEKGDDAPWEALQNLDEYEDERDLDVVEQADIFATWDILEMHLAKKDRDPTSVLNEKM